MEVRIYHLINPKNNQIFYVGATKQSLYNRLLGHKSNWINKTTKQLSIENVLPVITEIEVCDLASASNRESYWIKKLKEEGHPIENKEERSFYTEAYNSRQLPKNKKVVIQKSKDSFWDDIISEKDVIEQMNISKKLLKELRLNRKVKFGSIGFNHKKYIYFKSEIASLLVQA